MSIFHPLLVHVIPIFIHHKFYFRSICFLTLKTSFSEPTPVVKHYHAGMPHFPHRYAKSDLQFFTSKPQIAFDSSYYKLFYYLAYRPLFSAF